MIVTNPKQMVIKMAKVNYKNAVNVDKAIELAVKSAKQLRTNVQIAAIAVLMHAEKCGDYSKANTLVDELGGGVNTAALVEWFVEFGGLTVSEEEEGFVGWQGKEYIREKFQDAKAKMWYDFKPVNPWKGCDDVDVYASAIKRLESALAKVEKNPELANVVNIDLEKLAKFKALVA